MMFPQLLSRAVRGVAVWVVLACVACSAARGQSEQPAYELAVAGNEQVLWLVVGKWDPQRELFLQWLFYLDEKSRVRPARQIEPQEGRLEHWALVDEGLHVFFARGTHYRYTRRRPRREKRLPGHVVPEALAGESGNNRPCLWAVVGAETADAIDTEWARTLRQRATQPASDAPWSPGRGGEPGLTSRPADRPEGTYHLVQYDGTDWKPGFAAPSDCRHSKRFWMCFSGGRQQLFWQRVRDDCEIQYACYAGDHWEIGPALRLSQPPRVGFASEIGQENRQLAFGALAAVPNEPQRLQFEAWVRRAGVGEPASGRWDQLPSPESGDEKNVHLPAGSSVGVFGDRFVFLRMGQSEPEVGLWPTTGGAPDQPFREVPVGQADRGPQGPRGVTDLAPTFILAAVLLLVLWRRQESAAHPVILPAGLKVTGPGRRGLAALIDIVPPAAAVVWRWFEPITIFADDVIAARTSEQMEELVWPRELLWAWLCFVLLYTAYCTLFEMVLFCTPGKRLLGCRVLSETLGRPSRIQIGIRNLTRLVELEHHLQIWPFFLVILFTQNHQRVGDLVARTIVFEGQADLGLDYSG